MCVKKNKTNKGNNYNSLPLPFFLLKPGPKHTNKCKMSLPRNVGMVWQYRTKCFMLFFGPCPFPDICVMLSVS